jgi:hypothetical protein
LARVRDIGSRAQRIGKIAHAARRLDDQPRDLMLGGRGLRQDAPPSPFEIAERNLSPGNYRFRRCASAGLEGGSVSTRSMDSCSEARIRRAAAASPVLATIAMRPPAQVPRRAHPRFLHSGLRGSPRGCRHARAVATRQSPIGSRPIELVCAQTEMEIGKREVETHAENSQSRLSDTGIPDHGPLLRGNSGGSRTH